MATMSDHPAAAPTPSAEEVEAMICDFYCHTASGGDMTLSDRECADVVSVLRAQQSTIEQQAKRIAELEKVIRDRIELGKMMSSGRAPHTDFWWQSLYVQEQNEEAILKEPHA